MVQGLPERATGMLNDAPRPPTEIELSSLVPKLKRRGSMRVLQTQVIADAKAGAVEASGDSENWSGGDTKIGPPR